MQLLPGPYNNECLKITSSQPCITRFKFRSTGFFFVGYQFSLWIWFSFSVFFNHSISGRFWAYLAISKI